MFHEFANRTPATRFLTGIVWLAFASILFAPLGCAILELIGRPSAWAAWRESHRLGQLLGESLLLALLTILGAVPVGVFLGVALERFHFPTRRIAGYLLLVSLFIPLPVYAVAWQIVLGNWLPPLALGPGQMAWRPWNRGLLPAAWVHGLAVIPWVTWIVSASLRYTVPELEDEARMTGGTLLLLRRVLFPRIVLAAAASSGFIVAQTATEITVTDAMMVRTFAEEVYTQLIGNPAGVVGALAITVPVWTAASILAVALSRVLLRKFLADESTSIPGAKLPLARRPRFLLTILVWIAIAIVAVVPFSALVWKAGFTSSGWSFANLGHQLDRTVSLSGVAIAWGILAAVGSGLLAATFALWACWKCRERGSNLVLACAIVLAFTPGPILGLGLKRLIHLLMDGEEAILSALGIHLDFPPFRSMLYDRPSPLPGIWASAIRFFPVAVAILFSAVRAVPREQLELAKLDGVSVWRWVGWPMIRGPFLLAAVAVGVLSIGEVSASKLVVPPHWPVYILDLFDQMHYGTESTVAAMCLVQVSVTVGCAISLHRDTGRFTR